MHAFSHSHEIGSHKCGTHWEDICIRNILYFLPPNPPIILKMLKKYFYKYFFYMAYKSSLVFKLQIYYVFSVVLLNLYLYVLGLNYLLCLVVTLLCLNCCIIIFYEDFVMLELDFDVL